MQTDPPESSRSRQSPRHVACLGLGSNQDPAANLAGALRELRRLALVESVSSAWESPAAGIEAPDFVNAAVIVRTGLEPDDLVAGLKRIESGLGRLRGAHQAVISIDIDLLVLDGRILKADLWDLAYRAVPIAELLPGLRGPETGEPLAAAASRHLADGRIWPRTDILLDATSARASRAGATD